jgi:hypothetical protein
MIYAEFNQKTVKADLHVIVNYAIPPWNQCGKVPEDLRELHTEAGGGTLLCGDGRPAPPAGRSAPGPTYQPPCCYISFSSHLRMYLHRSLSWFD